MSDKIKPKARTKMDLTGQKFGRWTVLEEAPRRMFKGKPILRVWKCQCDCGTIKEVYQTTLKGGGSLSCGCLQKDQWQSERRDLTGKTFNRWTVLYEAPSRMSPKGRALYMWYCRCECGTERIVSQHTLENGTSKSCGCWHIEKAAEQGKQSRKTNKYDMSNEYGIGYTRSGVPFYFDKEDYELIKGYCWLKGPGGYIVSHGRKGEDDSKWVFLHRLVLGVTEKNTFVDHINHSKTDSRKCNLRVVTKSMNSMNAKLNSRNTSGYTGVHLDSKKQKWVATIVINKEHKWLGMFDNKKDAVKARKEAEEKYFGEYSYDASMELAEKNKIKYEQKEINNGIKIQKE